MSRKSTFGLKAGQLAELLSVSVEAEKEPGAMSDDAEIADLLKKRLETRMPQGSYVFDAILTMLGRLGCDLQHLGGRSLGEVLLDPQTDVGLLKAIKEHCKIVAGSLVPEAEASVATTIYYAASAGSIVYYDEKISHYSYEALGISFGVLAESRWMAPELKRLFTRACKVCKDKHDEE